MKRRLQPYVKEAAWYHRTSSSGVGLPKKPPTSAPTKGMPATDSERSIGVETARCAQLAWWGDN
jgi:hypothetical protein